MAVWGFGLMRKPLATSERDDSPVDTPEKYVEYLARPNGPSSIEAVRDAYAEATLPEDDYPLPFAPREERFLNGLVWPLRSAKVALMLSHHVTCIAVSGMVAEMVAILTYEMADQSMYHHVVDLKEQARLFGRSFDELGQERRIQVLDHFKMLPDSMLQALNNVRGIRRRYLHFLDQDQTQLPADARACYRDALSLVSFTIGEDLSKPKFSMNANLVEYLKRKKKMVLLK